MRRPLRLGRNLELVTRKTLAVEPLQDLAVFFLFRDQERQFLLQQDVLDLTQQPAIKIRRFDLRPDGNGQDLVGTKLGV